jgi:CDP-glycerol glycerophosphotransferase (TagB/SpsB family)
LVSDYSSLCFDFGTLRKPVIYSQFDYDDYRRYHYQKGYFDYEKDGFGYISHDLNNTVDKIIDEIENNCLIKKKYSRRINKFFSYFDQHNNDRIYMEIINIKNKGKSFQETISIILYILLISTITKIIKESKRKSFFFI